MTKNENPHARHLHINSQLQPPHYPSATDGYAPCPTMDANTEILRPPTGANASNSHSLFESDSDEHNQRIQHLRLHTSCIINLTTLDFAIRNNRQDNLVSITRDVLRRNGIQPDDDPSSIPQIRLSNLLLRSRSHVDPARITYAVVKWKRTRFVHSYETVAYGNCPMCYRAAPLGFECPFCPTWRSSRIYFVQDKYDFYPLQSYNNTPILRTATPADPHSLSLTLLNYPPTLHLDFTSMQDNPDYQPHNKDLFSISDIRTLLSITSRNDRIVHFGFMLEEAILDATNAEYSVISTTIDSTRWLFNTQQAQADLRNQRIINKRIPAYEPF